MTKLARVIDMERCMGCRACIAACITENHYTPGSRWNEMVEHEVGEYPNMRTVFATMGCMHCEDAPCQKVCDSIGVHAITRNELGVVLIDSISVSVASTARQYAHTASRSTTRRSARFIPRVMIRSRPTRRSLPKTDTRPTARKQMSWRNALSAGIN